MKTTQFKDYRIRARPDRMAGQRIKKNLSIILLVFMACTSSALAATTPTASSELEGVRSVAISLVSQDPDPVMAGDTVDIRVGVQNLGGEQVSGMRLELVADYPFESVSGSGFVQEIGTLAAYQNSENMKIVKFQPRISKDVTAGTYDVKVRAYDDATGAVTYKVLSIDVRSRQSAEVIHIDQVELLPGQITDVKFTINNVGSAPLRDLTFTWQNADDIILPVGSDNTKYVKYIEVGESAELTYKVIASANADPNLYKLDLSLTYDDPITGGQNTVSSLAGIYVGGKTDFDVSYSGTSGGETTFSVANIGSVPATSVTVRIPEQKGWSTSGSSSAIIGNLNQGDYTIASFTLQNTAFGVTGSGTIGSGTTASDTTTSGTATSGAATSATRRSGTEVLSQDSTGVVGKTAGDQADLSRPARQASSAVNVEIVYTDSRGNRNTIVKEVQMKAQQALLSDGTYALGSASNAQSATFARSGGRLAQSDPWAGTKKIALWAVIGVVFASAILVVRHRYKKGRLDDDGYTYGAAVRSFFSKDAGKDKY